MASAAVEGATLPGLTRQKGNLDLTAAAPDVWGSLDIELS